MILHLVLVIVDIQQLKIISFLDETSVFTKSTVRPANKGVRSKNPPRLFLL